MTDTNDNSKMFTNDISAYVDQHKDIVRITLPRTYFMDFLQALQVAKDEKWVEVIREQARARETGMGYDEQIARVTEKSAELITRWHMHLNEVYCDDIKHEEMIRRFRKLKESSL